MILPINNIPIPDDWKLILTPDQLKKAVSKCAKVINQIFAHTPVILVCILKGAVFFHVDLSRELTIDHSHYFIEASSYHDKQTQSETVQILSQINPEKFEGRTVILIDELLDNGTTMRNLKNIIHEKAKVAMENIFTCTALKKKKLDHTCSCEVDLYGLEVPDVWLVGYGLDDRHEKRNLTSLWACKKSAGVPLSQDDQIFTDPKYYENLLASIDFLTSAMV